MLLPLIAHAERMVIFQHLRADPALLVTGLLSDSRFTEMREAKDFSTRIGWFLLLVNAAG